MTRKKAQAIPQVTTSPTPPRDTAPVSTPTDFFDALRSCYNGSKITKKEWDNFNVYGVIKDHRLKIVLVDGLAHDWIISEADMAGMDWIAMEQGKPYDPQYTGHNEKNDVVTFLENR